MRFKALNASAMTAGALVPDIEPIVYIILGIYPDRLLMHSIVGAVSIDLMLALVILKVLSLARPERIGINGLSDLKFLSKPVILSAAAGSLTHVLVDSLHHNHNPLFWPLDPVYFTGPMVLTFGNPLATNMMSVVALAVIVVMVVKLMKKQGQSILLFFTNPLKAVSVLTSALNEKSSR